MSYTIATICARGGSKGLPGKNIKPLLGKPLICWTIEQALSCTLIDDVFISTDCHQIAEVSTAACAKVPFMRNASLSGDKVPKMPVVRELADWVNTNVRPVTTVVDLDPTSPLRDISDIDNCISMLDDSTDTVITGYLADKNPYFNMVETDTNGYARLSKTFSTPIYSRQDAPVVYSMNASIYCWHYDKMADVLWQPRMKIYEMSRSRSIDIDDSLDFSLVELLMTQKLSAK